NNAMVLLSSITRPIPAKWFTIPGIGPVNRLRLRYAGCFFLFLSIILYFYLNPNPPPLKPSPFDLQVVSWGDGTGVPATGRNLVIVGTDLGHLFHIRIYNDSGVRATDTDETTLPPAQAGAVADLKQRIPGLLPPHALTDAEKAQVVSEATSIA